ncbi:MAG: 2-C-methyl-D-erythritol 4-phosphate cytidylyltransferase [Gammaproteobacteria bacterium]|nr:2-C-methyl-D-erythritol 4-phosphate cytidylyltransferase [Gammaproteobacteria bacterium]
MGSKAGVWAIIPAAGSGSRMQSSTSKQYLAFQGKTIIEHCLDRLLSHVDIDGAVVVLNESDDHWDHLAYAADKPLFTAVGGSERQHSVYSGLTALQYRCGNDVIALVHDSVRPLVSHGDLDKVIDAARANEAGAILATPVADTLKLQNEQKGIASTLSREYLWRALTPQVFHLAPLLNALKRVIDDEIAITDDAQALEMNGYAPTLVSGSADNMKITSPGDLELAEMIWLHQRDQHNDE